MFFVFSCAFLEAFTWTKKPDNPTILVEGANTSRFPLEWNFNLNLDETLTQVTIERGRPLDTTRELIAFKTGLNAFNVKQRFENHYKATLPLTLVLLNVDNSKEYLYFVNFIYFSSVLKFAKSEVRIIVNGKQGAFLDDVLLLHKLVLIYLLHVLIVVTNLTSFKLNF